MNQRFHSAAIYGGAEGSCMPSQTELPAELAAMEQATLADAALLFAVAAVAKANGFNLRQQVAIWRPFQ